MSGAGSEWPKIQGYLGPVPNDFKPHLWNNIIKKAYPNLDELHVKFYKELGPKIGKKIKERDEFRNKFSFCAHMATTLKRDFEALGVSISSIEEVLPNFISRLTDTELKNCLVIAGLPKILNSLTYTQKPGNTKLSNITIPNFAAHLLLIKEWVENRGGKFVYFHTEDYPEELYNPELNPYFLDLVLLRLFEGDLSSLLGSSYYWQKYDGKHYAAGAHKVIAHKLSQIVGKLI